MQAALSAQSLGMDPSLYCFCGRRLQDMEPRHEGEDFEDMEFEAIKWKYDCQSVANADLVLCYIKHV